MNFSMKTRSSPNELFGLGTGPVEAVADLVLVPGDAHALAAAAGRRLDHDRIAYFGGDLFGMASILDHAEPARHDADFCRIGEFLGSILSPIASIAFGSGPMNTISSASSARQKEARSDRKP